MNTNGMELDLNLMENVNGGWNWIGSLVSRFFGAIGGAGCGAFGGPVGALVGGVVGAVSGVLSGGQEPD